MGWGGVARSAGVGGATVCGGRAGQARKPRRRGAQQGGTPGGAPDRGGRGQGAAATHGEEHAGSEEASGSARCCRPAHRLKEDEGGGQGVQEARPRLDVRAHAWRAVAAAAARVRVGGARFAAGTEQAWMHTLRRSVPSTQSERTRGLVSRLEHRGVRGHEAGGVHAARYRAAGRQAGMCRRAGGAAPQVRAGEPGRPGTTGAAARGGTRQPPPCWARTPGPGRAPRARRRRGGRRPAGAPRPAGRLPWSG